MFDAIENKRAPLESFYDGYIVNAILDAAYSSAKTKQWEPVIIHDWRGKKGLTKPSQYQEYDEDNYLIKREILPDGSEKVILKNKSSGQVTQKNG